MKRKKKDARTVLKRYLDKLIQQIYVRKYPVCFVCGDPTGVMHHFILKSQSNYLRYDARNLIPLCLDCHVKHHLSGDPYIHAVIQKKKGWKWVADLNKDRRKVMKNTLGNLREIKERLEVIRDG